LPPRPSEVGHFPIRLAGPPPPSAPLSNAGQGQRWEWKHSSLEPSRPGHWDFDAAEAEIGWIFMETCQKLRALWAVPCIVNASYPRAVRTRMAPLCLEGPGAGSSNELPAPSREPLERSESWEEASGNWVAHFDNAQSWKGMGRECYWSPLQGSCASTPSNLLSPGEDVQAAQRSVKPCWPA
jgi:hypothetical protein